MKVLVSLLAMVFLVGSACADEITYEKTDKPNIIKKIHIIETEIDLDVLQEEVNRLDRELEEMPYEIMMPTGKELLIEERDAKIHFLDSLRAISK